MTSQFVRVNSPYGVVSMFVDFDVDKSGLVYVEDVEIVKFTPSGKMRHKVIGQYRKSVFRPKRRTVRFLGFGGDVLEGGEHGQG